MSRREIALRPESEVMTDREEGNEKTNERSLFVFFSGQERSCSRAKEAFSFFRHRSRERSKKKKVSRALAMTCSLLFSVCSVAR